MPRGRRRKIELSRDTQPQFELEDIAEDIERRRREGEQRDERERNGQEERDRMKRGWRKRQKEAKKEERRECELTWVLM